MIYAVILIIIGLVAILLNKETITKQVALVKVCLAPLCIIWGAVGIIILTTIRYSVMLENACYWYLLIIGSVVEILIGILFISRYLKVKKGEQASCKCKADRYQLVLGILALVVGIATLVAK